MKRFSIYLPVMMLALGAVCAGQDVEVAQPTPGPQRSEVAVVPETKVGDAEVQKAIALFRRDPVQARDEGAVAQIMKYAEESPAVQLEVGPKVIPWMQEKADSKYAPLLLAAFVAGDVRAQLEGHNKKDDPMAGALQVIDTYELLRKMDSSVRFMTVEQWIALQKQGKLRSYLEEQ